MFGFIQPTIDTIGLFLISNFFALGTLGLPPSGRTLGRYPFHHKGRNQAFFTQQPQPHLSFGQEPASLHCLILELPATRHTTKLVIPWRRCLPDPKTLDVQTQP